MEGEATFKTKKKKIRRNTENRVHFNFEEQRE